MLFSSIRKDFFPYFVSEHMHPFAAFQAFFKTFFKGNEEKAPEQAKLEAPKSKDHSHLRLLSLLQEESRIIDFFQEDISSFSDEQIGKAIRNMHAGCHKRLEELVTIRPIFEEKEGETVSIPEDFNGQEIKILGKGSKKAPFKGILKHKGWKAHKHSLPKSLGNLQDEIIQAAEVELS